MIVLLRDSIASNRDNKIVSNMMHLRRLHTLSTLEWVPRDYFQLGTAPKRQERGPPHACY